MAASLFGLRLRALVAVATITIVSASMTAPAALASGTTGLIRDTFAGKDTVPLDNVGGVQKDAQGNISIDGAHPQPDTTIEPSIAVNPADPLNAVAAYQVDRVDVGGDADNGFATTFDGGQTWTYGYLPGLTYAVVPKSTCPQPASPTVGPQPCFDRASDAVVTFGADPTNPGHYLVYANSLVFNDGSYSGDVQCVNPPFVGQTCQSFDSGMAINVSKDGGRTWGPPVFLAQDSGAGLNDKNWIVVDNGSGPGHHTGRVYVIWDRIAPMVYAYCDPDNAATAAVGTGCDKPQNWSSVNNGSFYTYNPGPGIDSYPVVMPNGSLGVMFTGDFGGTPPVENPPTDQPDTQVVGAQIMFALAPGAGAVPWPAPLTFNPAVSLGVASDQSNCCAQQRAGTLPSLAVDPTSGQLYVAWEDSRFRSDGRNDLVYSTSSDGAGATWTPAARINPGSNSDHTNRWDPMIDVGPDGVVHVGYEERAEGTTLDPYIHTYYQESADHGATWSTPLQVDTVPYDTRYAAFSRGGAFQGDYNELATDQTPVTAPNHTGFTYIVRTVAGPSYPGEPCNCSFTSGNGHQHQRTWVSVVGAAAPPVSTPEAPWAGVLGLAGAAAIAAVALGRRRRAPGEPAPAD